MMGVKMNAAAREDFERLDPFIQLATREEQKRLKAWPLVPGVKHLSNVWAGCARLKVKQDWRLIFRPLETHVVIIRIRHRSVAYLPPYPPKK
jgi:mRNA-degrading endonuclease RelE of RelBE toxin-antitoxin system